MQQIKIKKKKNRILNVLIVTPDYILLSAVDLALSKS